MRYGRFAFYGGTCLHGLLSGYEVYNTRSSLRESRRQLKHESTLSLIAAVNSHTCEGSEYLQQQDACIHMLGLLVKETRLPFSIRNPPKTSGIA